MVKPLATSIEDNLPVEAERATTELRGRAGAGDHPLLLADRGIAITPLATGLRFGGWTELGG